MHGFRCSWRAIAAAALLAVITTGAAAQPDPCSLLPPKLETATKNALLGVPKEKTPGIDRDKPGFIARYAADDVVSTVGPLNAKVQNASLVNENPASVTFEGTRLKTVDVSRICVRIYSLAENKQIPVQQIALLDKDQDKVLKIVFNVEKSAPQASHPWARVDYLISGVIAGDPKAATPVEPVFFFQRARFTVADYWITAILSLLFVIVAYAALAWVTYPRDEDAEKSGETKEAKGVTDSNGGKKPDTFGGKWILYALSPVRISAAWFGEASMSQLQVLIFTFVVAGLMLNIFLRTESLTELSMDVLKLIGISAVGTASAKFTQTLKTGLKPETAKYLIAKGWYQWKLQPIANTATFRQLLLTDNRLDVYKFQMLIFTIIVALYILSAGQTGLEGVKISDTMIYLLGISQLVYVGGKAVTDRTTDLEDAAAKMRDLESKLEKVAAPLTDEQKRWLDEYRKAAQTAAVEYAFLQNRIYPREKPEDENSKPHPDVLSPTPALALIK